MGPVERRCWLAAPGSAGYFRACLRTTQSSRVGPRRLRTLTTGAPPRACAPSVVLVVAVARPPVVWVVLVPVGVAAQGGGGDRDRHRLSGGGRARCGKEISTAFLLDAQLDSWLRTHPFGLSHGAIWRLLMESGGIGQLPRTHTQKQVALARQFQARTNLPKDKKRRRADQRRAPCATGAAAELLAEAATATATMTTTTTTTTTTTAMTARCAVATTAAGAAGDDDDADLQRALRASSDEYAARRADAAQRGVRTC